MKKQIGILGSGIVGITLANSIKKLGYKIAVGNRNGTEADNWNGIVGTYAEVASESLIFCLTRPEDMLVEKLVVTKFIRQ